VERKLYSRKFQRIGVECLSTCEDVSELVRELDVTRRCLYKWRTKPVAVEPGLEASLPNTHTLSHRQEIHQPKRLLAEKAMEMDFLECALQKVEARRQRSNGFGGKAFTSTSEN
jgi:hypothetical protein